MVKFILESDKELEDVLENCPFGNKNSKLLAYVTYESLHEGSDERKKVLDGAFEGILYFVYEKTHELTAMQHGIESYPKKFEEKPNTDFITQYLTHVEGNHISTNVFIHLPSWVKNYLNKHKTHCKVQEANIGRMGDSESLFAGGDACERLKKLMDKADSD